jgi:putative hemolysin
MIEGVLDLADSPVRTIMTPRPRVQWLDLTRTDLLETVASDLPKIDAPERPKVTQREDGSYLIDASVPFSEVMQLVGAREAPAGDYVTLTGFILSQLHELPKPGDHVV